MYVLYRLYGMAETGDRNVEGMCFVFLRVCVCGCDSEVFSNKAYAHLSPLLSSLDFCIFFKHHDGVW